MAAAQKARWAKIKGKADSKPAKKGKKRLSASGRAAIIAATKARRARVKGTTATVVGKNLIQTEIAGLGMHFPESSAA